MGKWGNEKFDGRDDNKIKEIVNLIPNFEINRDLIIEKILELDDKTYEKDIEEYVIIEYFDKNKLEEYLPKIKEILELESIDKKVMSFLFYISRYYYKTDYFYKAYEMKMLSYLQEANQEIKKTKSDIEKINKNSNKLRNEIKNYKFDIIGLIAGVLSLFTIFGANYNFLTEYLNSLDSLSKVIFMFLVFNFILGIFIVIFLSYLKRIFFKEKEDILTFDFIILVQKINLYLKEIINYKFDINFLIRKEIKELQSGKISINLILTILFLIVIIRLLF